MTSPPPNHFILNHYAQQLNVAFININPSQVPQKTIPTILGIVGVAFPSLLAALQLKYQGSTYSPFTEHPKAMGIAIASLLIFCLGCDIKQHIHFNSRYSSTLATLFHHLLTSLGFISLACLATVILPSTSTSSLDMLLVYLIFALFFLLRLMLQIIQSRISLGNRGAYAFNNSQMPFAVSEFFNNVDTLPLYYSAVGDHFC